MYKYRCQHTTFSFVCFLVFDQDRIQRCVMQCQDEIRDRITPSSNETQLESFKKDFEQCVVRCADTHIDLIPSMLNRMKSMLI